MLIALFTLLFTVFLSGPEQIFIAPDVEKGIKKHIEDKDRKSKLLKDLKEGKNLIQDFKKEHTKLTKELEKEILSKDFSNERVELLLDSGLSMWKSHHAKFVEGRIAFQNALDTTEWNKIIKKASFPSDKNLKKEDKNNSKKKAAFNESINKTKRMITEQIAIDNNREKALKAFDPFAEKYEKLIDMELELNYRNHEILRNKNTSQEELQEFYDQQLHIRKELFNALYDLITALKDNTTDKEWMKMKKDIAKMIKERRNE